MQSDANHGFHAGEDADGDFDGLSVRHGVPRTVQQCADTFCGHEVARELDGYENRRQTVLFVGIVGCSRDFGQSRVQTLPVAQTEAIYFPFGSMPLCSRAILTISRDAASE